jgi:hypothetical protein
MSLMSDIDAGVDDLRLLLAPEIRHELPSQLNTQEKFQFLYIDQEKTSATYEGRGVNQFDAGVSFLDFTSVFVTRFNLKISVPIPNSVNYM